VASDMSSEGMVDIEREQAMEAAMAEQALRDFEVDMGLVTPETRQLSKPQRSWAPPRKPEKSRAEPELRLSGSKHRAKK